MSINCCFYLQNKIWLYEKQLRLSVPRGYTSLRDKKKIASSHTSDYNEYWKYLINI